MWQFFFGIDVGGNRGWLRIAGIQFQPAEFMKFTICLWFPLVMISMMRLKPGIRQSWKAWDLGDWGRTFGLYVLGLGSVLLGKDLGTALVIILIGLMAIVASGFPMKYVGLVGIAAVVGVAILTVFSSNRMSRIMATYTGCTADNIDVCYQATHSNYALASGGLLGVGLGNSREKWNYLPAAHNDFIFAIIGEELGLVGAAVVIALFLLFLYAGTRIAQSSPDNFGTMVAGGCTIMIAFQAFLNIAMVIGWFPVVGKPLPFISSGGSSLVAMLIMVGIILSVSRGAEAPTIYDRRRADLRVVRATNGAPPPSRGGRSSSSRGRR